MIIDMHVHIGKTEKTERAWSFSSYAKHMDANGIDSVVAMPNVSNEISFSDLNQTLLFEYLNMGQVLKKRCKLLFLVDPHDACIEGQLERHGGFVRGLKYHPSISRMNVGDKRFYKWVDIALERDWPILVHCGRDPISHIKYLVDTAKRMPRVNFIAAHMGGNATDLIEKAIIHVKEERVGNVYLDTSSGSLPWLIEKAVDQLGRERILFGSDEPYSDLRVARYTVDLADISIGARECIFYKNAVGLFK